MKALFPLLLLLPSLLLTACSIEPYHMGGLKPAAMKDMNTFCMSMFDNHSTQPTIGMLMTTALSDALQRDGTYRMAPRSKADFEIGGEVKSITREARLTDPEDSYLSTEVGINVLVSYTVKDLRTGKMILTREAEGHGSYFTAADTVQSALESALSNAARTAADTITTDLTTL